MPPHRNHWLELKVPPPLVALAVAVLMGWVAHEVPLGSLASTRAIWQILGAVFIVTGLGLDVSGVWRFVRAHTTVNPLRPANTAALVTMGVYRWTRNPMYLGMALVLIGWSLWLAHLLAVGLTALFVLYITRFQILPEERYMQAKFGQTYLDYQARVRRWL